MKNNIKIAIIDYEMGNLFSVKSACESVGLNYIVTSNKNEIINSNAVILPGVGAFGDAMENLKKFDLINPLKDFIASGKYFMGICLGMQLLLSESEEFGLHQGLNIIEGSVIKFPNKSVAGKKIKVPQVGWNKIYSPDNTKKNYWEKTPLQNISNNEYMYFVHSFYCQPQNQEVILSLTNYEDTEYCSSIFYKNIFACQFHPEKSATAGIQIYKNWLEKIKERKEN